MGPTDGLTIIRSRAGLLEEVRDFAGQDVEMEEWLEMTAKNQGSFCNAGDSYLHGSTF